MADLNTEILKRRTFGIISHPDAGKTTLTEKFLLFGGAIQVAGAIKAKKATRHATSDFMEIEKQRGISVATSVMGFNYKNKKTNYSFFYEMENIKNYEFTNKSKTQNSSVFGFS